MTTKPLTIIYDGARNLAPNLIAADGSVGIRVTSEEFSKQLCFRFRKAIVSTSANISGQPAPAVFSEITEENQAGGGLCGGLPSGRNRSPQTVQHCQIRQRGRGKNY